MDWKFYRSPVKMPYIGNLIHSVKIEKINDDIKTDTLYVLDIFGYHIVTILHKQKIMDLFDPKYKFLLITLLNEAQLEQDLDPQSLRLKSLSEYINGLENVGGVEKTQILRKIYRTEMVKKIDRVWHLLRDLYGITVGEKYIAEAVARYTDREFGLYYQPTTSYTPYVYEIINQV